MDPDPDPYSTHYFCVVETERMRKNLDNLITNENLSQYYSCPKKIPSGSRVFRMECEPSSSLHKKHGVTGLSIGFCERNGNRGKDLENTSDTGFYRPHCAEMLAITEDGRMRCDHPDLDDVVIFWREDGTDSHITNIVDFLRKLEDSS